jgi:chromate reductase
MRIVGLCGSLRTASYNRGLLKAVGELLPEATTLDVPDLTGAPEFNEDIEALGDPLRVSEIRAAVERADILLFAIPEYNYGLPGWFKNVFDWLSRPPRRNAFFQKPAGILSASFGERGAARAQMALRASLVFTDTYVMPRPELFVGKAATKYDANGNLIDEATRTELRGYLAALLEWSQRFQVDRADSLA